MTTGSSEECGTKPHSERWFYRRMYSAGIFELTRRLHPIFGRTIYRAVARMIAWTYAASQHGVRRTVVKNLNLIRPGEISNADAVRVFTNFGNTLGDYITAGCIPLDEVDAWCTVREGREHLSEAFDSGHGAILVTGHYGFFEYGALLINQMGWKISVVTLEEPSPDLTEWRAKFRGRWGAGTIPIGEDAFSSIRVMKALERGEFAAMLIDRPFGEFTTSVDLCGGKIPFSMSAALIAFMADAPIVPVVVAALPGGKYRMVAKPCIWPRRMNLPRKEAVESATHFAAKSLIDEFAQDPSQWYQFPPLQ